MLTYLTFRTGMLTLWLMYIESICLLKNFYSLTVLIYSQKKMNFWTVLGMLNTNVDFYRWTNCIVRWAQYFRGQGCYFVKLTEGG